MEKENLVYRLRKRAEIRRQIPSRKSVQEGAPDRIADLLEEAASEIERLHLLYAADMMSDKGYKESTFEEYEKFNRERNYPL
jgi:hypothetical protein